MFIQRTITIRIADDPDLRAILTEFQSIQQRISVACYNDGKPLSALALHRKVRNIRTRKTRRRLQESLATHKAQHKDTRSVRRLLKRPGRTQGNRTRTFCQQTAAKLLVPDAVLVFERLTLPQTSKKLRVRKGTRRRLSQWQRHLMRVSVTNAAERRGVLVDDVNPAYTSQDCSRCGLRGIRKRHAFTCPHCGYKAHADVNAAINIRHRYTLLRQRGPPSTGPEALSSLAGDEGKPPLSCVR